MKQPLSHSLLAPDEPGPCEVVAGGGGTPYVLLCDHASNRIPRRLRDLGLARADREAHIGWDIGAADLARGLARALSAPLVLTSYSRLVIDCNRPLDSAGSIATRSAGVTIAANQGLTAAMIHERRDALFHPYHQAIAALLDERERRRQPTVVLSLHSFTPDFPGAARPWQIDFAYHRDRRLAGLLLDHFDAPGIVVGDNLPYAVDDESDYSIPQHGERRGLPHVLIEIRQDMLATPAAIGIWVERLAGLFHRLLPDIDRLARATQPARDHAPS